MDALFLDLRYACRQLRRAPAFSAVAVLVLALGIGANTAIFSIVKAVLLDPPPFHEPDRLVAIWEESSRRPGVHNVVSPANFVRWVERATAFEPLAAYIDTRANLTGSDDPEEVVVQRVTAPFFATLGVAPLAGRTFSAAESLDPNAHVVVLGYELWQRRFGGDAAIVGRTIQFNAAATTVIGIMPRGFGLFLKPGAGAAKPAELWAPYVLRPDARDVANRSLAVVARLKPDLAIARAQSEMTSIAADLATEFPDRDGGWTARVVPIQAEMSAPYRDALVVLFGAVGAVLCIACGNVANLLLVRATQRGREIRVRIALGAARGRLVRQLLTESLLLAGIGGALGLVLCTWTLDAIVALNPVGFTPTARIAIDPAVLLFTLALSVVCAIACGLAPAYRWSRDDARALVHAGSGPAADDRRSRRLRDGLVAAEIALAVILLAAAGLLLRSLQSLHDVRPGFDTGHLLTLRMQVPAAKYDAAARVRFFQRAESEVAALPGVRDAGVVAFLPLAGSTARVPFTVDGEEPPAPGQTPLTDFSTCDNGYLRAIGLPLRSGRLFSEREMRERSDVALVNESLARQYFHGADPIGRRLRLALRPPATVEIVGVVADMRAQAVWTPPVPTTFIAHPQLPYDTMTVAVRTDGDPLALAPAVTRAIRAVDRDQPVSDVRSMDQWIARSLAQSQFSATLVTAFSVLALLLATMGVYGVVAFAASVRTAEIGLRIALGATTADILRIVAGAGVRMASIGIAAGLALALVVTRLLGALLFEISPADPLTLVTAALALGGIATAAGVVPGLRAARTAPVDALRHL